MPADDCLDLLAGELRGEQGLNDGKFRLLVRGKVGAGGRLKLREGILTLIRGALQYRNRFVVGEEFVGFTLLGDDLVRHCGYEGAQRPKLHFIMCPKRGGDGCFQGFVDSHMSYILHDMDLPFIIGIIAVVILAQAALLYFILRRPANSTEGNGLMLLQQQMQELARTLDAKVSESSRAMQENAHRQFSESTRLIKEITTELTSVKEIGRQTQTYAEQLQSLQDLLKNPKQRGILGEYYLETTLKNVLPPGMYQIQYPFKNGEVVDAVVFVQDKVVPVDSKFSLDNYNRFVSAGVGTPERAAAEKVFVNDLKLRIQETAKYIRPEEGTMDFAFMFIPSEGIYYDLLSNQVGGGSPKGLGTGEEENLIQRAASKYKVIIVSPTSFLAYLQTVLQGMRALQIEQKAADIQKRVGELGKHIGAYEEFYKKLGASLGTTVSHYNSGYKELGKIDKDVYRISGEKQSIEPIVLDKPLIELD